MNFTPVSDRTARCLFVALLCSAIQPAARAEDAPADLVLRGGKIVTVDERRPVAQAIATRGDRIVAVASDEEIGKLVGPKTRVIELRGRLAIPGFIEGHGHFTGLGQSRMMLDLMRVKSWDEIIDQVAEAARKAEPGEWIIGRGWHQEKWTTRPEPNVDGYPTHDRLSRVTPKNPVLLTHASGHMSFANAEAMRLAGVDSSTQDPPGGEVLRDQQDNPIGVFRETAQGLISRAMTESRAVATGPRGGDADRRNLRRAIDLAMDECLANGVTSFQDAGSSFGTIDVLKELAARGELKLRLWVMVREDNATMARRLADYRMVGFGDNHLTVRGIKRAIDGALGPHGAWLLEPYDDLPHSAGLNTSSIESIRETARLAIQHDYQLCVHAIGDRANREVLNIFEEAFRAQPSGESRRWRIEHAQHLHPDDIPRFARLGVIASMQGVHCTSDAVYVRRRLGPDRSRAGAYVWQSLMKAGAVVTNGTDVPVEDISPIESFHATVTRRLADGSTFFPEQRMTRAEALRSYTRSCAYAAFEEDLKGSLTPGKLADFVVLSRDIMTVPDDEIPGTQVLMTIVGGKVMYERPAAEPASSRGPADSPRPVSPDAASRPAQPQGVPSADSPAAEPALPPRPTGPLPAGLGRFRFDLDGTPLEVFTFKPTTFSGERMIMVMHGVNRNADEYRDHSQLMAERFGALVIAPRFDSRRFPTRKYQMGGILTRDNQVAPAAEWTYALVPKLARAVREVERRPDMRHWIIGHSAGGQFVVRMAAFADTGAERLVAANPGSHLFPTHDLPFGYGFGRLPAELCDDATLRRYLAAPLTIFLGTGDHKPDRNFDRSESAMKQGDGRWQRGRACFAMAERFAAEKGWPFHWRLVEAADIVHDHEQMFNHAACERALFGDAAAGPSGKRRAPLGANR